VAGDVMGYVRTVMSVLKQMNKTAPLEKYFWHYYPTTKMQELSSLLNGIMRTPPTEFGRFNKLRFRESSGAGAEYFPTKKVISMNPEMTTMGKFPDFMHELTHAKQYNPDPEHLQKMKDFIKASSILHYKDRPIEVMADRVASFAYIKPRYLNKYFDLVGRDPQLLKKVTDTLDLSEKLFGPNFLTDLNLVKPYRNKGWLYGGAGIGMARTGEE
jgi:hypothetical protein